MASLLTVVSSGTTPVAAAESPAIVPERLYILGADGRVAGTLSPSAPFEVTVLRDGAVQASKTGTTGSDGGYSVSLGYDSGRTWGIHNGDVVRVRDGKSGAVYEQRRQLAAIFEEDTGLLVGTTVPGTRLAI